MSTSAKIYGARLSGWDKHNAFKARVGAAQAERAIDHNQYQPKTGQPCHCKRGQARDNCPDCEGTGQRIDFAAIRARRVQL